MTSKFLILRNIGHNQEEKHVENSNFKYILNSLPTEITSDNVNNICTIIKNNPNIIKSLSNDFIESLLLIIKQKSLALFDRGQMTTNYFDQENYFSGYLYLNEICVMIEKEILIRKNNSSIFSFRSYKSRNKFFNYESIRRFVLFICLSIILLYLFHLFCIFCIIPSL